MIKTEPIATVESIKLLLYITSSVLVVSVGIIGYFFSKRDSAISTATDNLVTAVQQLKTIVDSLQLQYEIRQPIVDAQLELHRKTLEENSLQAERFNDRLLKIETEHQLFKCNFPNKKPKSNSQ
jgi:hypothetical protein